MKKRIVQGADAKSDTFQSFTKKLCKIFIYQYAWQFYIECSYGYITLDYSKKLPTASSTASILEQNLRQALATVSLGRLPITSVIFAISRAAVLWGDLFTSRSQTLHTW